MIYNILFGGAAGQGIDTACTAFENFLLHAGCQVLSVKDLMSRIRGGHNFNLVRFGDQAINSHDTKLDGLVAMNKETLERHAEQISAQGFMLCDDKIEFDDPRLIKIPLTKTAKDLGNPKTAGSVAVGALLGLFGMDPRSAGEIFEALLGQSAVSINVQAVQAGIDAVSQQFDQPIARPGKRMLVSGSQTMALGAVAGGLNFYCAYPMSPSTAIMVHLAGCSQSCDLVVEQAEDEIAALNMAIGASFAGARAMTGTSGGGFSLMVEALGLAGITETPVVIANVQRPGPATGLPTRTEQADLKFVISASQGEFPRIVIAVRDHLDAFYQTRRAFVLAERYQVPVILLSDQYLGDATSVIDTPDLTGDGIPDPPDVQIPTPYCRYRDSENGVSPRILPGHPEHLVLADSDEHDECGRITESAEVRVTMTNKRLRKLDSISAELEEPWLYGPEDADVCLVGWGSMSGPLKDAVDRLGEQDGQRFAALIFGDVYPLPTTRLTALAGQAKKPRLVNVEQNATGQLAGLIREETGIGMAKSILRYDGRQMSGREIAGRVLEEVGT